MMTSKDRAMSPPPYDIPQCTCLTIPDVKSDSIISSMKNNRINNLHNVYKTPEKKNDKDTDLSIGTCLLTVCVINALLTIVSVVIFMKIKLDKLSEDGCANGTILEREQTILTITMYAYVPIGAIDYLPIVHYFTTLIANWNYTYIKIFEDAEIVYVDTKKFVQNTRVIVVLRPNTFGDSYSFYWLLMIFSNVQLILTSMLLWGVMHSVSSLHCCTFETIDFTWILIGVRLACSGLYYVNVRAVMKTPSYLKAKLEYDGAPFCP